MTGAAAAAAGAADEWFVLEFQVVGGAWQREPLSSCRGARFEEALSARPFRFGKGLRSCAGWWYFATTGAHAGFESWLERDHLMLRFPGPSQPCGTTGNASTLARRPASPPASDYGWQSAG